MTEKGARKLLLINPANRVRKGFGNDLSTSFMPLGLGIVAALTPAHWEVELLDESFEDFTFRPADLVAFTSFTSNAPRAYEIAAVYREAGIHTVMGGIHASMCTGEAVNYFDTIVIGEAEGVWPALIADFESGGIKPLYEGGITDINSIPHVRRDIYKYPYTYDLVQTSRGCPLGCDFCSVTQMCGKSYRERNVEDVLDELETTTRPMLLFADDNLVNNKKGAGERAIRLFKGMIARGIKKHWIAQVAVNFADNNEVLYWAGKSGCVIIMMGIESETSQALQEINKHLNLRRGVASYEKIFNKIHSHGIGILATMMFGLEGDTKEDLYARGEFIKRSTIDAYQCTILTPLPGTTLFDRLKEQDRIVLNKYPADWQHYHFMVATIDIPTMNHGEINTNIHDIWFNLYDKAAMRRKMFRTLWNTGSFTTAYWAYACNHNYCRMCLERVDVNDANRLSSGFSWKNFRRTWYLKFTDKILWLFYLLVWKRMLKRLAS